MFEFALHWKNNLILCRSPKSNVASLPLAVSILVPISAFTFDDQNVSQFQEL